MTEMDIKRIYDKLDHTNLKKTATTSDILLMCSDAAKHMTKSVCVPPCFVSVASKYLNDKAPLVCTVIGFPNGYSTTAVKIAETIDALENGADEIDMVININVLKGHQGYNKIFDEIKEIAKVCHNYEYSKKSATLKVIIETCLLTKEEIRQMCDLCIAAGADFIKTSTGFSTAGATREDIKLFSENIGENVKMKAAGGIASLIDAEDFLKLGAQRLGTSRIVSIAKSEQGSGY